MSQELRQGAEGNLFLPHGAGDLRQGLEAEAGLPGSHSLGVHAGCWVLGTTSARGLVPRTRTQESQAEAILPFLVYLASLKA